MNLQKPKKEKEKGREKLRYTIPSASGMIIVKEWVFSPCQFAYVYEDWRLNTIKQKYLSTGHPAWQVPAASHRQDTQRCIDTGLHRNCWPISISVTAISRFTKCCPITFHNVYGSQFAKTRQTCESYLWCLSQASQTAWRPAWWIYRTRIGSFLASDCEGCRTNFGITVEQPCGANACFQRRDLLLGWYLGFFLVHLVTFCADISSADMGRCKTFVFPCSEQSNPRPTVSFDVG